MDAILKVLEYNIIQTVVSIIAIIWLYFKLEERIDKHKQSISDDISEKQKNIEKKVNLQDERIDTLDKQIMLMLEKVLEALKIFIDRNALVAKSSPLKLTKLGNDILEDSEMKDKIQDNYNKILQIINLEGLSSSEEINDKIIHTISNNDFTSFDFTKDIKKYLDKRSSLILSEYKELVAVYFRDLYFQKNGLNIKDIKE